MSDIIERLVCDESFIRYCTQINERDKNYWDDWIAGHPDLLESFQQAQDIVFTLSSKIGIEEVREQRERIVNFI